MKYKRQERDYLHTEAKKPAKARPELEKRGNRKETVVTLFLLLILGVIGYLIFHQPTSELQGNKPDNSKQVPICNRTEMYPMPPEFKRVLSLILQRKQQKKHDYAQKLEKMMNCLDIRYSDLSSGGAEGVFYLDKSVSSPEKLVIEVDSNYSFTDDLTTALLLSHELTHARQYTETLSGEKNWGCVDSEVEAYYEQLVFATDLNEEEQKSITARLEKGSLNSQLKQYEQQLNMSWNAALACGAAYKPTKTSEDTACWQKNLIQQIRTMVIDSPFYQKQCNL